MIRNRNPQIPTSSMHGFTYAARKGKDAADHVLRIGDAVVMFVPNLKKQMFDDATVTWIKDSRRTRRHNDPAYPGKPVSDLQLQFLADSPDETAGEMDAREQQSARKTPEQECAASSPQVIDNGERAQLAIDVCLGIHGCNGSRAKILQGLVELALLDAIGAGQLTLQDYDDFMAHGGQDNPFERYVSRPVLSRLQCLPQDEEKREAFLIAVANRLIDSGHIQIDDSGRIRIPFD